MRLLVTGANGQLGWELSRRLISLGAVIALGRDQCDLAQPSRLPDIIRRINPDVIVNAAAYTAVDKAELEEEFAVMVNGKSVGVLAEEARRVGAILVHYSTDYVFDGTKKAPYSEEDMPCPTNAYGRSKLAGETAIQRLAGAYIILRTSWVYAARGRNFVRTILKSTHKCELQIVADQVGAPTWAREIADATAVIIRTIVQEREERRFASGLFNLTASGATSWHGFAQAILELGELNGLICGCNVPLLRPVRSEEYPLSAVRPKNSRLAGEGVRGRFGISLPHWKEALAHCLAEMRPSAQVC
jgi:dTDP-4-dehydrorhamnose reductase